MMLFVNGNLDAHTRKSMSNLENNQFQQISLQSTWGLVGVIFLKRRTRVRQTRQMWQVERGLLYMLTSIREMAEFPELINCCLSFIFHLHCRLLLQLWMQTPKAGRAGVTPAEGASPARSQEASTCPPGKYNSVFNYKAYSQPDAIWLQLINLPSGRSI